jgi:hypothetical protein
MIATTARTTSTATTNIVSDEPASSSPSPVSNIEAGASSRTIPCELSPNGTESEIEEPEEEGEGPEKGKRMNWSMEMIEALVEVLHKVFQDGGAADNSFKNATFEKTAVQGRAEKRHVWWSG